MHLFELVQPVRPHRRGDGGDLGIAVRQLDDVLLKTFVQVCPLTCCRGGAYGRIRKHRRRDGVPFAGVLFAGSYPLP